MILHKTILILEDNLLVLSKLLDRLYVLEQDQPYDFSLMVLTNYRQVEEYVNHNPKATFDIILLDRDCKLDNSFHVLNIERFGAKKVIAISSVPAYNQEVQRRGVQRLILKDFKALDEFVQNVVSEVATMLKDSPIEDSIVQVGE